MPFVKPHRKYYKYGTEPNVTVVGSPTISNGVVSGFSYDNWMQTPSSLPLNGATWEMVFKIKTPSSLSTEYCIAGERGTNDYQNTFTISNKKVLHVNISTQHTSYDSSFSGSYVFQPSSQYWVKLKFTGSAYELYYSLDGKDFTLDGSKQTTYSLPNAVWNIGRAYWNGGTNPDYSIPFLGSIDLTQSYIKINGQDWWHGTKVTEATKDDYEWYVESDRLYSLARKQRKYYKYVDWTQPVLTSDNMSVAEGNIVTTASSYYIDATRPHKVMLGAVSSTTDSNYWQINNTTATSWLQIKFPYKLRITGLSVYSRPRDNFSGTVTAYTDSSRSVKIGNAINTSAELTKYTFLSGGSGVETDTIYLYVTNQNQWFGLQNLQITAQKVVEGDASDYDYYKDNLVSYSPIVRGSRTYYKQSEKQRNAGTYTFTLDEDYTAKMLFVGNGGGGGSSQNDSYWRNTSGGSGACFQGRVRLPKGTYTLTIGTLGYGYNIGNTANMSGGVDSTDSFLTDSNGNELIRAGCGQRGTVIDVGGNGGTLTLGTLQVLETTKAVNGNKGETNHQYGVGVQKFAKSAYDGTTTGYGAGTSSYYGGGNVYGVAGIFDLVLETDINDYNWYEDVGTKIY